MLIQLRVGGQAVRIVDESVPVACGCLGQETTGYGGLAKALRTVPVVLDIAERVRRLAPDAWIVDFTNPVGIVTKALLDEGHRAVGLCSAAMVFQRHFARRARRRAGTVELDHAGLNHLTWELGVRLDGDDVLPRSSASTSNASRPQRGCRPTSSGASASCPRTTCTTSTTTTASSSTSGRISRARRRSPRSSASCSSSTPTSARDEKPELLGRRGGAFYSEAAVELLASLFGARSDRPARGQRPQRRRAAVPRRRRRGRGARARRRGRARAAAGARARPARSAVSSRTSRRTRSSRSTRRCAAGASVFRALLAHPLIGQADARRDARRPDDRREPGVPRVGVIGVDGGNTKTGVVVAATRASRSRRARAGSNSHGLGAEGCVDVIAGLVERARRGRAGRARRVLPLRRRRPRGHRRAHGRVDRRDWARQAIVDNDTFALLRTGTTRRRGRGRLRLRDQLRRRSADGRIARYPSLGWETGDWGGSEMLGARRFSTRRARRTARRADRSSRSCAALRTDGRRGRRGGALRALPAAAARRARACGGRRRGG